MPQHLCYLRADQIVRGSAARALRAVGGSLAIFTILIWVPAWFIIKDPTRIKILALLTWSACAGVFAAFMTLAAALTVAQVRGGTLSFFFCGLPMRSFPLDADTTFELRKIRRLRVLVIHRGRSRYFPNRALNRRELIGLLRANGVARQRR